MKALTYEELCSLPVGTTLYVCTYKGVLFKGEIVTFLKARGGNVPDRVQIRNIDKRRSITYRLEHQVRGLILFYI